MQASELVKYINNPHLLDKESVKQLQKLVIDFPYFQSAHVLLSIASKKWDASIYQQSLKKTAIVATNRSRLFELIHQAENPETEVIEKTAAPEKEAPVDTFKEDSKQELDILKAAEITTEAPVIEAAPVEKAVPDAEEILEQEIGKQVVAAFVEKEILKTPEVHDKAPQEQPESFGDWLSFLKKNNGQPYQQIEEQVNKKKAKTIPVTKEEKEPAAGNDQTQVRKEKNKAIIDKIIQSSPGLIRQKEDQKFFAADAKAKESLLENEHLVTETLAKIYALQGNVNKAVRAYEILSLKYPQKSAYFATLIQKLKHNQ